MITACLGGTRIAKVKNWQPRYMSFPMQGYTKKGGIQAIEHWDRVKHYASKA